MDPVISEAGVSSKPYIEWLPMSEKVDVKPEPPLTRLANYGS